MLSVLLVSDDFSLQKQLSERLHNLGHTIVASMIDLTRAIAVADVLPADLVIADLRLFEEASSHTWFSIPVVYAASDPKLISTSHSCPYLLPTFTNGELTKALEVALNSQIGHNHPPEGEHTSEKVRLQQVNRDLEAEVERRLEQVKEVNHQLVWEIANRQIAEDALCDHIWRLEQIYSMVYDLNQAETLEDIYNIALEGFQSTLKSDCISILVRDRDHHLRLQKSRGLSQSYGSKSEYFWQQFSDIQHQEVCIGDWRSSESIFAQNQSILESESVTTVMSFPLSYKKVILGRISIYYSEPYYFSEEELKLSRTLATYISIALSRKQNEIALKASQEFVQHVADTSPSILYIYDLEHNRNIYCNREIFKVMGYSSTEIQAMGDRFFSTVIHRDDYQAVSAVLEQMKTAREGEVFRREYRMRHADGSWRWIYSQDTPFARNERGEVKHIIGTATDITDRRQAEELLELFFSQSINGFFFMMLDCPVLWNDEVDKEKTLDYVFQHQRITKVNDALLKQYGVERDRMMGLTPNHFCASDITTGKQKWQQLFDLGRLHIDTSEHRLDGSQMWIEGDYICLYTPEGKIAGHFGIQKDVTESRLAEETVRALERERELNAVRIRFFSMASHELRTPLSNIIAAAKIMEYSYLDASAEKRLRNIQRIQTSAKRLLSLLEDILALNRLETSNLEFRPQPVDLDKFCRELVQEIEPQSAPRQKICLNISPSAKSCIADEQILRYIIVNLLVNAIKYSPDDSMINFDVSWGFEGLSETDLLPELPLLKICIRDRGIGIPPSDLESIFKAFHRGKNVAKIRGSGLGLTMVKKCVELHQGSIAVDSELGQGTTIKVTIPCLLSSSAQL